MKLRNIISIVTAGLFMMSACTDEELIDSSTPDSGLSISLTTKGVMTKAAADGYTHSTPDEIKINTCAIAFFDVNTNERVGFSYNTFEAASGNLEDGRAYYSVSNILVKGGTYNMLVLANSSLTREAIQAANTYSAFKALKETLQDQGVSTFEAANLVKFGEKEVTINKGEANEIQVELTQLAARIDLSFKVNVQPEEVGEPVVEEKWTMDELVDIATKNPDKYVEGSDEPGECKMHSHQGKWLYVPNNVRTTTTTKKAWMFSITKVMVSNVALKSNSFMETEEIAANADDNSSYLVKDFEVELLGGTATVPFYTYEKTFNPQEHPLSVKVDGNLQYGTFKEKKIETFSAEYQWISDQGGGGWGASGKFDKTTVISSETKTTQEMTETIDNMEKSYKLAFNPTKIADCKTYGVVHGNLYDVVGTIDVNTREAKFNWTLKPWNVRPREISVDIVDPAFLVVANTEMTMPNITSISTMFQSSSPIHLSSSITVTNGSKDNSYSQDETSVHLTISTGNSGSINITSDLPINFVPKEISFTVTNEEGLSENVKVHQYPPLYI
ncbi:fimbrial protein, partial [uncultured Parabacteroides sp.]